jgi:inosine triphosphate pyrophosphatase
VPAALADIKWFVDQIGNEGLYRMLADHEDKSAYCECVLGFSTGPGAEPELFVGRTHGTIVEPRGEGGFGWDSIFIPEETGLCFGAIPLAEKNRISHRARALHKFVRHCRENEASIVAAMGDYAAL